MVNDFMVCVDRIIASACLHKQNDVNFHVVDAQKASIVDVNNNSVVVCSSSSSSKCLVVENEVKECRICQEEDDDVNLESPCACNGTLKFAHKKCIQKWCNKKGDITCEICNQVFAPNYSIPPPRLSPDVMAVDLRQAWGHPYGFHDHNLLALTEAERHLLESEYDDYEVATAGNVTCLRSIAIILMFILMIHQVLMITRDFGLMQGYSTFFNFQVSVLQLAGFLLPCYVLGRSWYLVHMRRRRQMGFSIGKAQRWWEKGLKQNMREITSADELVGSLLKAGDQLVVVDFFSLGCGGCKVLHPKICQLTEMNPEVQFLQVNYEEHNSMCYSLNVHVLPFFRFYRGSEGRVCSFSCTNAMIKKFKDALAKHGLARCSLGPSKGLEEKELIALAANKDLSFTYTPNPVTLEAKPVYQGVLSEAEAKSAGEALSASKTSTPYYSTLDSEDRSMVTAGR